MLSALSRKSTSDLSRRRSRTFFAILTLALAVASIGIFAMPSLMNRSMQAEVRAGKLPDLTVFVNPVELDGAQLAALSGVPNVRAVEPRSRFDGRVYIGARRAPASVVGVPQFGLQRADVVHVASGRAPGPGEVLTDLQNANQGLLSVGARDSVRMIAANGSVRQLHVVGEGRNLNGGQDVTGDDVVVLYAGAGTVASLSGVRGYESLAFRLADTRPAAVDATIVRLRTALTAVPGFRGFRWMPEVRAAGDWPGKSDFDNFSKFFYVITALAILSAFVLIANTLSTLVAEQTSEIGTMKAIGARRRQLAAVYVKTAMLLGALATVFGIALGIVLSNVAVRFFGSTFFAIDVAFGVDWRVLLVSVLVGVLGPAVAALPAIRRATRVPLREALEASGSAVGSQDAGDALLRRVWFLPRTAQIGLRNVGRRRRRSLATALIIALAVGNLLAVLGLAAAVTDVTHANWRDHGEDVKITTPSERPLGARGERLLRTTPGVASVEPMFDAAVTVAGQDGFVWALRQNTMFRHHVTDGRWYTPAEERAHARVAVAERSIARATGAQVGDRIQLETATGPIPFRVIGIASNLQDSGTVLFAPLATMHAVLRGTPSNANDYWVRTSSSEHAFVDRTTTLIEDRLTAAGYEVGTEIEYVGEADNVASNRTITTSIAVLGLLIVAISLVGLANALTMSVIERTREIGILRTIGARGRDVRRIFAAEAVTLAFAGWLLGIPIGYLLDRGLVWLMKEVVNIDVPFAFPLSNVALALAGSVLLALIVTLLPIRRAVRYRPGKALRYA
ncbi:MAG TPA: FtsX-like permease family protein [Gaiellaceae bacterium]|nr:FtsX-like permease family protein [Gaiellaceae bacterium]